MTDNAFQDIAAGLHEAIGHAKGGKGERLVLQVPLLDIPGIRAKLRMTQEEFATAFGVSVGTIRNWEQGRRAPRGPARVLLQVIDKEPNAVRRALDAA